MSVEVGQVYEDADPRSAGRTVEVMRVDSEYAFVRLNTVARNVARRSIGRKTRIRLDRLTDTGNYWLSDVEPHRFGKHKATGELGYHPLSELQQNQP